MSRNNQALPIWKRRLFLMVLSGMCLLLVVPSAPAQETTAGIQGYVKDSTGAVVPRAKVEVSGPALIGTKSVETDPGGYYRFTNLPPGEYSLTVSMSGFRTYKQTGIQLDVGKLPTIEVALQIGTVAETVEVSGQAPIVDVTQSKAAAVVSEEVIANIPKGRSFQSLIPYAPGARQEPLQSRRDNAGRDNGFQIDGASDSENTYLVEGLNTTDIQDGGVGKNVPFEFVQEVQIKSSGFEAEYGGAMGGVVNVIQSRGSNRWHGSVLTYYRSDAFNANDQCQTIGALNTQCGLRGDPNTRVDPVARLDQSPEYYIQKKDHRRIVEPGFEIGGPILTNRLWLFASYVPTLDRVRRTVNFTGSNPGVRSFVRTFDQHNALTRLDYLVYSKLRVFASWQYGFSRTAGVLPGTPDSPYGQKNNAAGVDPNTIRSDTGTVNPSSVYNVGADWNVSPRFVVSGRYGYFFYGNGDRGRPIGTRYLFDTALLAPTGPPPAPPATQGLDLQPLVPQGSPLAHPVGFSNIGGNFQTLFDAYKRKSLSSDASYFRGSLWGTHNFKFGYGLNRLSNDLLSGFNTAFVLLDYGIDYTPGTSPTACNTVIAQNIARYGPVDGNHCRGNAGYFIVRDGVDAVGQVSSYNHALYLQDSWTVGHGLTLNLGVRFDKEFVPPYSVGADSIDFGFGDKIAPRIGVAYDLLRNGKLKIYGSYGKFFDIMKYSLPRGSFGGEYWHDCVYAMDDPNFNLVLPTAPGNHACPPSGPAPGVSVGRFIENQDFRKNVLSPTDPGVDPNIKPMQQHEFVVGADWALTPKLAFEVRYARKRLDQAIEDIGINDNLGFYIGNPGPNRFADLLHRPASGLPAALCPACPAQPPAMRRYDGVEFRLTKRPSSHWFGTISYTYSRLRGNYSGLTDTDVTDGNGGRHSPNNHRAFDQPQMQFTSHGQFQDGPLGTDRPHTLKVIGYYRLQYWGMESTFGVFQSVFSGTPISTCMPTQNTASSCVFVENRGNFVMFRRDPANRNIVSDGVMNDFRTEPYMQTDFSFGHEWKVSKTNEALRLGFEWNIQNLFNQHSVISIVPNPFATGAVTPTTPGGTVDWNAFLSGWDYVALSNTGSSRPILSSRYGLPNMFQISRNMRLKIKFIF